MAANRLGIFTFLGERKLSAEEIARGCGTHPRSTTLLLNACAALGLLHKEKDQYTNSAASREFLVKGKPTYIGDLINHADRLWSVWAYLDEAVRTNQPAPGVSQRFSEPEAVREFILAMHNRAMRIGPFLAEALELQGRRQLFDVGGGPGTYSIFLVKKYPELRAIVFDLPGVVEIAQELISEAGMAERISTRAGDYFEDDFGQGNDVVLLSMVLHSMGPPQCKLLLQKSFDSLVGGGWVVVHEGLIDPEGTSPVSAALFSLNMLLNTGEGQSRSAEELMGWMKEVGFDTPFLLPLPPERTSLVVGVKPDKERG
jgi:predicted O-methyltransferase YrrM